MAVAVGSQFSSFATWYAPGKGDSPAERRLEGGVQDRKGRPAYTLEQYLAGNAPYVAVAMDAVGPNSLPYGTILYNNVFKDDKGQLVPFRVVDTGGAFRNQGLGRIDIATSNLEIARGRTDVQSFQGTWQIAGGPEDSISVNPPAPGPDGTPAGDAPPPALGQDPNGCAGLNNGGGSGAQFNVNNSPPPSNGQKSPPGARGGGGVTTNYVPTELEQYGNGKLPLDVLTPVGFPIMPQGTPGGFLYGPAAEAFKSLVRDAGDLFMGITDHYRDYAAQVDVYMRKPGMAATPGTSKHGWGLAIDFATTGYAQYKGKQYGPFLEWLKKNAYKYNIYGLAAKSPDPEYKAGFWRGEIWHWEYRGGPSFSSPNDLSVQMMGPSGNLDARWDAAAANPGVCPVRTTPGYRCVSGVLNILGNVTGNDGFNAFGSNYSDGAKRNYWRGLTNAEGQPLYSEVNLGGASRYTAPPGGWRNGDVLVFNNNSYGHAEVYVNGTWYSDFKQSGNSLNNNSYDQNRTQFYRMNNLNNYGRGNFSR